MIRCNTKLSCLSEQMVNHVVAIGGVSSPMVEATLNRLVVPSLERAGLDGVPLQIGSDSYPGVYHYTQLEVNHYLLDPRLPYSPDLNAFLRKLQVNRKTKTTYLLPVTYDYSLIGGEYPNDLKQRLGRALFHATSLTIEVGVVLAYYRAVVTNLQTGEHLMCSIGIAGESA